MKYTKKQIIAGYIKWNTSNRLNPSKFMTDEEFMNTDVEEISELQADELIEFINE